MKWFRQQEERTRVLRLYVHERVGVGKYHYSVTGRSIGEGSWIDVADGVRGEYDTDEMSFKIYDSKGTVLADFADSDIVGWALVEA